MMGARAPPETPQALRTSRRRRALIAWLASNPGASLQEVADSLGVTRTAANYHVRCLVKANLLRRIRKGRRVLHFAQGHDEPGHDTILGSLRQARVRRLLHGLRNDPTMSWRSLAAELDITPRAVRWHVRRLEEAGAIQVVDEGPRSHLVKLHPAVARHLNEDAQAPDAHASYPSAAPMSPR